MGVDKFLVSEIAKKFYLWFVTLCFTVVAIIFIYNGESHGIWYDKMIGAITLAPLAIPMKLIFRGKIEKEKLEYKLSRTKEKHEYKLEKLRIKKGITKG